MIQVVKAVFVPLVIVLSLTSDTASSVTQVQGSKVQVTKVKEPSCSTNSFDCASNGPMLRSLGYQNWTAVNSIAGTLSLAMP